MWSITALPNRNAPFILSHGKALNLVIGQQHWLQINGPASDAVVILLASHFVLDLNYSQNVKPTLLSLQSELLGIAHEGTRSASGLTFYNMLEKVKYQILKWNKKEITHCFLMFEVFIKFKCGDETFSICLLLISMSYRFCMFCLLRTVNVTAVPFHNKTCSNGAWLIFIWNLEFFSVANVFPSSQFVPWYDALFTLCIVHFFLFLTFNSFKLWERIHRSKYK